MRNFVIRELSNLVTSSFNPTRQPNIPARSPTMITRRPIIVREMKNEGQPPSSPAGGMMENIN